MLLKNSAHTVDANLQKHKPYPRRLGACATSPSSAMIRRTAFSETPVLSMALMRRYPYLPLEAANASATLTRTPAYLSMASRAWW